MLWVLVEGRIRRERVLSACRESIEPSQIQIRRPFLKGISRPPFSVPVLLCRLSESFTDPYTIGNRPFELIYITIKRTTSSSFSNRLSSILIAPRVIIFYELSSCATGSHGLALVIFTACLRLSPPYYFLLISSLSMEL